MSVVYKHNGQTLSRKEFNALPDAKPGVPMAANTFKGHKPLISESMGVLRAQVDEARQVIKKHNIKGVTVKDSGQLEITSRRGRKEFARVRGKCDYDGGYGDG